MRHAPVVARRSSVLGGLVRVRMADQQQLRDAVAKAKLENPNMGVKKLVALVKKSSPGLAKIGAKEVRQALALLDQAAPSEPSECAEQEVVPALATFVAAASVEEAKSAGVCGTELALEEPVPPPKTEKDPEEPVPPPVTHSSELPPRPRSALKSRGTNGNAPGSSGKTEGIQFSEQLLEVRDIEPIGNCTPTPARTRGPAMRQQQSAGQALMRDPEIMQLMSQPGVMAGVQEIMNDPQTGLPKYQHNPLVMVTFMKIQEKMKLLQKMEAGPLNTVEDGAEEADDETEQQEGEGDSDARFNAQAVAVLLKRGRMALMRGDVDKARGALKAGLQLDITNGDLKALMQDIKLVNDRQK